MNKYQFFNFKEGDLNFKLIFLVGPCRSGKSSLGRLLGSLPHHFHIEENWQLLMAPIMYDKGLVTKEFFVNTCRAWINELIYDALLMRTASFRRTDHSYIRKMKSKKEINFSLNKLQGRVDVNAYLKSNPVVIILNLAEINVYMHLLKEIYSSARIILLNRNPDIMAEEVFRKGWFSQESLRQPSNRQIFLKFKYKGDYYYLPFWVGKDKAEEFIKISDREKAYYYAYEQYYLTARSIKKGGKINLTSVFYEDLIDNSVSSLKKIASGMPHTAKTKELLKEIKDRKNNPFNANDLLSWPVKNTRIEFINRFIPGFRRVRVL